MSEYQARLSVHHRAVAEYVRQRISCQIDHALNRYRSDLVAFSKALRARTSRKQEEFFAQIDFAILLRTFRIWLCTLAEINELLPLRAGLFDLAIIDEATQCDMAGCLPVFYRAQRAAITGDPQQLRHLSFLARERQSLIAGEWHLSSSDSDRYGGGELSRLDRLLGGWFEN